MIFHYLLIVSAVLFCVGVITVITRRNLIMVFIGIELILNAANVNLVAFSHFDPDRLQGQMMALFVIVIAAAEASVALAIAIQAAKRFKTTNLDDFTKLNG